MNFRGFATKLKASAAEMSSKIPTFDDMAAKDEYIHTDDDYMPASQEVVVPRRTPYERGPSQQEPHQQLRQEPASRNGKTELDDISSAGSSSWSLLDNNRLQTPVSTSSKKQSLVSQLPTSSRPPIIATPNLLNDAHQNDDRKYDRTMSSPLTDGDGSRRGLKKQNSSSSLPLLAVVADALSHNDDESAVRSRRGRGSEAGSRSITNDDTTISMSSSNENDDDSSTDDSDYDSDGQGDDDPILSMIQKSHPEKFQNKKRQRRRKATTDKKSTPSSSWDTSSSSKRKNGVRGPINNNSEEKSAFNYQTNAIMTAVDYQDEEEQQQQHLLHNSNSRSIGSRSEATNNSTPKRGGRKNPKRFLDDLDDRLSTPTPVSPFELEMGRGGLNGDNSNAAMPGNQRWGWVKSMATTHVDRFLGRLPMSGPLGTAMRLPQQHQQQQQQPHRAPLARQPKAKISTTMASPDDDFQVTVSASVLGDNELKELAQMKNRSSLMDLLAMLGTLMKENRQFAFIGATMILAALVYFYTRNSTIQYSTD